MSTLKDVELYLVNDLKTANQMMEWLKNDRTVLGLDTETSGLNAYASDAKLRTIQIGDANTGWVVPWERWGGAAIECLDEWKGPISLHNASFDAHWMGLHAGWEFPWHRIHDTMIMAQITNPHKPAALKTLSTLHIDPLADDGQKQLKETFKRNNWDWATVPIEVPSFWIYSALDPVLTARLFDFYRTDLAFADSYELEMAILRICSNMERGGMRVDLDYALEKYHELMNKAETAKQWAQDNWNTNIGSTAQLADFFVSLGANFTERTPAGAPSVAKKQLETFMLSDNEMVADVAKFVTEVKNQEKMASTYFKNFLEMNTDGVLHPSIRTNGARTGRMSVVNPALQTLPSKDSLVRNAFVPTNEGEILISCDYSQIELRLMAHFSRDEKLQEAFANADATGGDFFVEMGKQIYNDPNFSKSDPRRKLVKGTMYGLIYGAGPQKMADTAGVTFEEMSVVVDSIHEAFPGIQRFMKEVEAVGNRRERETGEGYIVTATGRKLPCDQRKVYSLVNFTLQGNAAEILKQALVRLDAAGYGPYMKIAIHDEVVFSMPEHMVADALPEIEEIMSVKDGSFAVPLLAEPEIAGDRWGNKYAQAA